MRRAAMLLLPAFILLSALLLAAPAQAEEGSALQLPASPVEAFHLPGTRSHFEIALGGVGGGYDLVASLAYPGWCLEAAKEANATQVTLYSSLAESLPGGLDGAGYDWHKINYLLNHKQGTGAQVQQALWALVDGNPVADFTVQAMLNDAHQNGAAFVPAPGQVLAVILFADGVEETAGNQYQDTILEVTVPGTPALAAFDGRAWYDRNQDGQQAADEAGAPGIPVALYRCEGELVATTVTGDEGDYRFGGLAPGDYFVQFTPLAGFLLSPAGTGEERSDSDADANGESACGALAAGEQRGAWDAGLHLALSPAAGAAPLAHWRATGTTWPVAELTVGGVRYTRAQVVERLAAPAKRDRSYGLFGALVAARLGAAAGAEAGCIAGELAAADGWLAAHGLGSGVTQGSSAWQAGAPLAAALEAYNQGLLCAPAHDALGAGEVEGVEGAGNALFLPSLGR